MHSNPPANTPASSLTGRPIAITRVSPPAYSAATALEAAGAEIAVYVCAEILPAPDSAALDRTLQALAAGTFDYLLLPSLDGVLALADHLRHNNAGLPGLSDLPVITFGSVARQAAQDLLAVEPRKPSNAATPADLVAALHLTPQSSVLIAQSSNARPDWSNLIARARAKVETVAAYRAVMPMREDPLPAMLWSGVVDAILFISDSDVRTFSARLKHDGGTLAMLDHVCVACLDVQTAAAARSLSLHVDIIPDLSSPSALVTAVSTYFDPQ